MKKGIPTLTKGIAMLCLALGTGCSRKENSPTKPSPPAPVPLNAEVSGDEFRSTLPRVNGRGEYTGSKNCQPCHKDQYESWHRTYHRTMTQFAGRESVQADFNGVVLTNAATRFRLSHTNDEYWVRMEHITASELTENAPEALDVRIGLLTGSHHMQVFWAPAGEGNVQVGFPFTWLIPERRWVPRNSTFVRPPDMAHRSEVWNVVCSRCHTTGVEPRVDLATHTVNTEVGELGISCEACHGPGERHVRARQAEADRTNKVNPEIIRSEIIHPKKIDPVRAAQICGFCHSMKWFDKSEGWPQRGFRFRPGDDLEKTTPIIQPSRVAQIPGLAEYLARHQDLLQDFFWPDGMVRVSGREFNGVQASPCFKGGQFSCLSCHSLHESEPSGLVASNREGNAACTQCHTTFREEPRLAAHTHHRIGSSGSGCYNCHMPFTTYGVLKGIRSHQVSSPRIADELASGRPNACNLCHLDKPLGWTADYLAQWFRQPAAKLSPEQTGVADSVRLALAGDAGQRVLMAWHFGWGPALEVSGKNWEPAILASLLDDPYAAVRCVAERSLRKLAADLLPSDFDYATGIENRAPVQSVVWSKWRSKLIPAHELPAGTLVNSDAEGMDQSFQRIAAGRDNRPVRLRE